MTSPKLPDVLMSAAAHRRPLIRLLVLAQVLYVLGVAGAGYATTAFGKRLILSAGPIAPHELTTGDFVRLTYGISAVPLATWRAATPPKNRQSVYVLLNSAGPDSTAVVLGVYPKEPTAATGQAILRGWVMSVFPHTLALRFGLERYYVPENSFLRHEKPNRPSALRVRVSIAPWGQARITGVEKQ